MAKHKRLNSTIFYFAKINTEKKIIDNNAVYQTKEICILVAQYLFFGWYYLILMRLFCKFSLFFI